MSPCKKMVLIPDNPQKNEFFVAFTDYQEHSLQTTREITDRYLESQKEKEAQRLAKKAEKAKLAQEEAVKAAVAAEA